MHVGAPPAYERMFRKWRQKAKTIGIGIGIGVAVAIAVGFAEPARPIAIAIATAIPIPTNSSQRGITFPCIVLRAPSARVTVANFAADFRPGRDFAASVGKVFS
jgi:hypothetical protein